MDDVSQGATISRVFGLIQTILCPQAKQALREFSYDFIAAKEFSVF